MRYRCLGKTGLEVSEVGFGAIPIIRLSFAEAEQVLRRGLERGINFYDTAHLYVDSEEKIGRAFAGKRQQVILASKTMKRDRQGALEDLELSLRRLGTDYLDLYQLHQVSQDSDWETLTGPEGALDALHARQRSRQDPAPRRHLPQSGNGHPPGPDRALQHHPISLQFCGNRGH